MTNTETINKIEADIQNELNEWNNKIYEGEVPKDFMKNFAKAFMATVPSNIKMFVATIEKMLAKTSEELSNVEVATICNLISAIPPKDLYNTLASALKSMKELENVRIDYNIKAAKVQQDLNAKKSRLVQLSGASLSNSKLISV